MRFMGRASRARPTSSNDNLATRSTAAPSAFSEARRSDSPAPALTDWLRHPPRRETYRSEMLLKLFLGGRLSPGEIRGHVQQFKEEQTQLLLGYADIERRLRREEAQQPHLPYWMMTLRYGQRRAAALTAWADETLRALGRVRPAAAPRATQSRRKRR